MADVKNMAGYFSSLIPYIGMVEGGIVLGKDAYDHSKNPRITEIFENDNIKDEQTKSSAEKRDEQSIPKSDDIPGKDSEDS